MHQSTIMYHSRHLSITRWWPWDKRSFLIYQRYLIKFGKRVFSSSWSKMVYEVTFVNVNVITDFLYQRKQRVVLNGQHSSWTNVQAGVPQRSILGPLFFLIYINDLSDGLTSNPKLFADDTSLYSDLMKIRFNPEIQSWPYRTSSRGDFQ